VLAHYKGDLSRINMNPAKRNELMAKYAEQASALAKA